MEFLNKTYKNRVTGDIFKIIDVYQNVAITSNKEKINTNMLTDDKFFIPVSSPPKSINESMRAPKDDSIDPNKFFSNQTTYNAFADQIKRIPMDRIPNEDDSNSTGMPNSYSNLPVSTNESAIVMSDPEDEIEELKRKYGAVSVDSSIRRQNETFAKFLEDPQETQTDNIQRVEVSRDNNPEPVSYQNENKTNYMNQFQNDNQPPVQRVEAVDPITQMFKNVKRNTNFNLNIKITGKIPRLDFIEMMEDSYDVSIIEFLADEFTRNILNDPSVIRNKVITEIKSMIEKNSGNKSVDEPQSEENKIVTPKKTTSRKKRTSEPQ
jgi:hypothetical protein